MLFREKINDWSNFIDEKTSGVYPYLFNAAAVAGWLDITSIKNIDDFGFRAADYYRATSEINILFQAKTGSTEPEKWSNCTQEEKEIISRRQIVSKSLRLEIWTAEEDQQNFNIFAVESVSSRRNRIDRAKIAIGYEMTVADRQDLFNSVAEKIERWISTGDDDFLRYMESIPPYSGGGFKSKPYWSQGLEDIYYYIIVNGNK